MKRAGAIRGQETSAATDRSLMSADGADTSGLMAMKLW